MEAGEKVPGGVSEEWGSDGEEATFMSYANSENDTAARSFLTQKDRLLGIVS